MTLLLCPEPEELDGQFCHIETRRLLSLEEVLGLPKGCTSASGQNCSFVRFVIPSFVDLLGEPIFHSQGFRRARTTFLAAGWLVTIDRLPEADDSYKAIRDENGHYITHRGVIQRADRALFSIKDIDAFIGELYWIFSFICASRRGIGEWQAFDEHGRFIHGSFGTPRLGDPRTFTWFPKGFENPFPAFAEGFIQKLNDPFWKDVMLLGVHTLCEANLELLSVESKLILGQTALEMLSSAILQEHLQQKPEESASARIRSLLHHVSMETAVPSTLNALIQAMKANSWSDGPDAITKMRNMVAHPKQGYREGIMTLPLEAKFEAMLLCLHYVESLMLWLVGYDGPYVDRTNLPMILGKHKKTPWPIGGARP